MLKTYLKPETEIINVTVENIIATSPGMGMGGETDSSAANRRRGNWGNLWE